MPVGWEDAPVWTLFTRVGRNGYPDETLLSVYRDHGIIPKASRDDNFNRASEDLSSYQLVEPGDLVINKMKAWQGSLSISRYRGIVSPAYFIYRPHHPADERFLHHLLRSRPLIAAYIGVSKGVRIGQWDLEPQAFSRLKLPLPPLAEQHAIADYLDRETAQIDALIGKQARLIETLRERRAVAIEVALSVRVGSGDCIKWLFQEVDARAGTRWVELPLLSVSISWGVRRRSDVTDDESRAEDLSNYKECQEGDLILNRMRAFQGALGVAKERGLVSPDYAVLRLHSSTNPHWLAMALKTPAFVYEMAARVRGIGHAELATARTPRLNVADLGTIRLAPPSRSDQSERVAAADEQTAKIDALIAKAEQFIEVSKERRSALITAAVTGQIDVRGVGAAAAQSRPTDSDHQEAQPA